MEGAKPMRFDRPPPEREMGLAARRRWSFGSRDDAELAELQRLLRELAGVDPEYGGQFLGRFLKPGGADAEIGGVNLSTDARPLRFGIAVLAIGLIAFATLMAGVAQAAPIGKGGKIYACYATTGQSRGAVRVVGKRQRCHRGERKIYWGVAGPAGAAGARGPAGPQGAQGAQGAAGSTSATQQNQIDSLTTQVQSLQSILQGLSNQQLLDAIANAAKLNGISASTLTDLVGTLPIVSSLCSQLSTVTNQTNLLRGGIAGVTLTGALALVGGLVTFPSLPALLPVYTCPS